MDRDFPITEFFVVRINKEMEHLWLLFFIMVFSLLYWMALCLVQEERL